MEIPASHLRHMFVKCEECHASQQSRFVWRISLVMIAGKTVMELRQRQILQPTNICL